MIPRHRSAWSVLTLWLIPLLAGAASDPVRYPEDLSGEYELRLEDAEPFHDILQIEIRSERGRLLLKTPEMAQTVELDSKSDTPLRFSGVDSQGEILYEPGREFELEFSRGSDKGYACTLRSAEIHFRGRWIAALSADRRCDEPLTAADLRHDLDQLRRIMEEVHPALYDFTGPEEFAAFFDRQAKRIGPRNTLSQAYEILAAPVARIGCGHAMVDMPQAFLNPDAAVFIPLRLHVRGRQAFVMQSLEAPITPGSEILAINGLSCDEIICRLEACITSDGLLDSTLVYRLNHNLPRLYASVFGHQERFVIRFRASAAVEPVEATVSGIHTADLERLWPKRPGADRFARHLGFEILPERKAAILTIHSFGFYQDNAGFFRYIDQVFAELRQHKTEQLILDLRDNDGGDPLCSAYLLKYLCATPVAYFQQEYGDHYAPLAKPLQPVSEPFRGTLWTLIDSGCLSSTTHLCALLRYHGIGRFVGGETAGNYRCNDSSKTFVLSHSGLRVTLARATYAAAVAGMDRRHGILPDYPVEPSLSDLLTGQDTVRNAVLKRIAAAPGNISQSTK